MKTITRPVIALSVVLAAVFLNAWPVAAATQPRLGSAANFAVLAGSTESSALRAGWGSR